LTAENKSQSTQRFYDLVWPHRATVLRIANILTDNAAEGEDLAQETLLKAFRALHTLHDEPDVRAWLLTILRHARVDQLRSAGRSAGTLSLNAIDVEPRQPGDTGPASHGGEHWERPEEILNAFSDQQVIDALQELPEDIRLTLLLVDVEQLDHSEAATLLAVPVGTIKSRTHRGRAMLRQVLSPVAREMGFLSH
jgi:RNA polymerase sigma-70 factor (ECF subfamily)